MLFNKYIQIFCQVSPTPSNGGGSGKPANTSGNFNDAIDRHQSKVKLPLNPLDSMPGFQDIYDELLKQRTNDLYNKAALDKLRKNMKELLEAMNKPTLPIDVDAATKKMNEENHQIVL